MTPQQFRAIYAELIEENPLAVRAVLKVLRLEFTEEVPTLAVTIEAQPRLRVNLDFVARHCHTEAHVKAVICHEFLHILLRHTERHTLVDRAEHLALDAVINAIIHRELGPEYSSMMSRYYADVTGLERLLRPGDYCGYDDPKVPYHKRLPDPLVMVWHGLYAGKLVADDIIAFARDLAGGGGAQGEGKAVEPGAGLLGGHQQGDTGRRDPASLPEPLRQAIERSLKTIKSTGIWRSPLERSAGCEAYSAQFQAADVALERWCSATLVALKKCLTPDARAASSEPRPSEYLLPVLSAGDRRAAMRALWSPFLPEAVWPGERPGRPASAQVYLDVSGSMYGEMPLIIRLLSRLSRNIRRPFWAFSDVVAPARIIDGKLVADTTHGTNMNCVLKHVAQTRPAAALIVTDGHIGQLSPAELAAASTTRLHAVITRGGNPALLQQAGISCTPLWDSSGTGFISE